MLALHGTSDHGTGGLFVGASALLTNVLASNATVVQPSGIYRRGSPPTSYYIGWLTRLGGGNL